MKVRMMQKELSDAISALQSITDRKSTMPILANILFDAKEEGVFLTATDLEVGTRVKLSAQVFEEGKLAVPSRHTADIVRELSSDLPVDLESLPNHWLYIKSGTSQFRLAGLDASEFPSLPERETTTHLLCSGKVLAHTISKVAFAMSKDETRYHLNGVYFDGQANGHLRLVATDGHRLSCSEVSVSFPADYRAIVPRKGVAELQKFCERAPSDSLEIYLGKKNLDITSNGERLIIRLIEGEFPKYEQVIPKETETDPFKEIAIKKSTLASALRRVCILANERSFGIRVSFSTGNMEISTQGSEKGEGKEELECGYRGEFFQVGFNARYFLDVLGVIEGDTVILKLKGALSPCLVGSPAEADQGWQAVLMPMRI